MLSGGEPARVSATKIMSACSKWKASPSVDGSTVRETVEGTVFVMDVASVIHPTSCDHVIELEADTSGCLAAAGNLAEYQGIVSSGAVRGCICARGLVVRSESAQSVACFFCHMD